MNFRLDLTAKARKELDRVPSSDRARLLFRLWDLKVEPRPRGCVMLAGSPYWRLRQGDWRAIYLIDEENRRVLVVRILRRNERTYSGVS